VPDKGDSVVQVYVVIVVSYGLVTDCRGVTTDTSGHVTDFPSRRQTVLVWFWIYGIRYLWFEEIESIEFREYLAQFVQSIVMPSAVYKNTIKIHRTIILPLVLYGCETWSQTLRE
jgi:hypothetical protein